MRDALATDIELLASVNRHIIQHSGKMLRPMLSLLAARACAGSCTPDSHAYAAASELLHNATLLHDDVADESDTRRGQPTLRAMMGPAAAVLVGDFWLSRAVDLVVATAHKDDVVKIFSKTLSSLAEGEMLQLQKAETADTSMEDYLQIIYCKTASLFEAACESGAISVGAPQENVAAMREYAYALGVAFQIKDDILDYSGDDALGKPVGIDLREQKITLPLLAALGGSPREAEIRAMVADIAGHPDNCGEIRAFVEENDGVSKAADTLEEYISRAVKALDVLPDSPEKTALVQIARYNSVRNS